MFPARCGGLLNNTSVEPASNAHSNKDTAVGKDTDCQPAGVGVALLTSGWGRVGDGVAWRGVGTE